MNDICSIPDNLPDSVATTDRSSLNTGDTEAIVIALVGDSTVADYSDDSPWRGWGQILPKLLPQGFRIANFAINGMSTKTFRDTPNWDTMIALQPDIVLIQFGHNDSHAPPAPEGTAAEGEFRSNLQRYISEARDAGIYPILVTPMHRRTFGDRQIPTQELASYAEAVRAVGKANGAPIIDLHDLSGVLLESLGEEGSAALTLDEDRTHFTEQGAIEMAQLVLDELLRIDQQLSWTIFQPNVAMLTRLRNRKILQDHRKNGGQQVSARS